MHNFVPCHKDERHILQVTVLPQVRIIFFAVLQYLGRTNLIYAFIFMYSFYTLNMHPIHSYLCYYLF